MQPNGQAWTHILHPTQAVSSTTTARVSGSRRMAAAGQKASQLSVVKSGPVTWLGNTVKNGTKENIIEQAVGVGDIREPMKCG